MAKTFQPANLSSLSPVNFSFFIEKIPTASYFGQQLSLPGLTLGHTFLDNPFIKIPIPGDHIQFEELALTFLVDEDMVNWLEAFNWMIGLGFPEDFEQYKELKNNSNTNLYSDGMLTLYTGEKTPNIEFSFKQMFPTGLSGLKFQTTTNDVSYFEATISFSFAYYTVKKL